MALNKQNISINFDQGLETKTDPFQVPVGKFLALENSVFQKGSALSKRNGYGALTALPDQTSDFLTTFNGDLTAIGTDFQVYGAGSKTWSNQGAILPAELSTITLIRSNTNQAQVDSVTDANGLMCTVYTDQDPASLSTAQYRYVIANSETGQNIVQPTVLAADATYGTPRVFVLGNFFIILYTAFATGTYHIRYLAISTNDPHATPIGPVNVATTYTPALSVAWDAYSYSDSLYIAYNGAAASGIHVVRLISNLNLSSTVIPDPAHSGTMMSVTADANAQSIWVSYYDSGTQAAYAFVLDTLLNVILAPTNLLGGAALVNWTSVAANGSMTFYYEFTNAYSYDPATPTNYIGGNTATQGGSVGSGVVIKRSVGLASKAFIVDGGKYFLTTYQSPYQNTYFLMNDVGNIIAKLCYQNGGGYLTRGLPGVTVSGSTVSIPYRIKTLIQAVNKNTDVPLGSQTAGIYSQTGLNLAKFTLNSTNVLSAEIGNNLNVTGGFLWAYDGYDPVEQGFFLYPDSVGAGVIPGGAMAVQQYYYVATYEWTDNQGNAFRSAPSIPITVTTTAGNQQVQIGVPTYRLTYKTANPVKIVLYRWSVAQQTYYQTTSITAPVLNSTTVDSVTIIDGNTDAQILGNNLLYTTGGTVENIGAPSFKSVFLFDNRLFGITSEDRNLLWFSKQVIQGTPVEMSDLFTIYVAPNIGAQGSTGPLTCGASMDDKCVLFKETAIYYFNGAGPDNTGVNNQYSPPTFVTSTVGCSNQKSIVFQPAGLMFEFESPAGNQIWLLGRDLSTQFIGASVQGLTQNASVLSAVNIPGTNEVRFTLSSGITLMYDYYYQQWGTFTNVPAVSSCLYQGKHTYSNSLGQVFQETPGQYLDGSNPVLMSFTTGWINFNMLQGYQRFYAMYLLGVYYSPHKLLVQIAYDYNSAILQQSTINPTNFSGTYGQFYNYGVETPYGGPGNLEQWRIFPTVQRSQSFQITCREIYDPSLGVVAGAGLTLSGISCVVGFKKGFRPFKASQTVGADG